MYVTHETSIWIWLNIYFINAYYLFASIFLLLHEAFLTSHLQHRAPSNLIHHLPCSPRYRLHILYHGEPSSSLNSFVPSNVGLVPERSWTRQQGGPTREITTWREANHQVYLLEKMDISKGVGGWVDLYKISFVIRIVLLKADQDPTTFITSYIESMCRAWRVRNIITYNCAKWIYFPLDLGVAYVCWRGILSVK